MPEEEDAHNAQDCVFEFEVLERQKQPDQECSHYNERGAILKEGSDMGLCEDLVSVVLRVAEVVHALSEIEVEAEFEGH